jgi:hypothetical protein
MFPYAEKIIRDLHFHPTEIDVKISCPSHVKTQFHNHPTHRLVTYTD